MNTLVATGEEKSNSFSRALSAIRIDPMQFNLAVAVAVFATYLFTTDRLNENLQAVGLFALLAAIVFSRPLASAWWIWAGVGLVLGAGIVLRPLDVPNHHFMLAYSALALAICLSAPREKRLGLITHNFRLLIIALMAIATVQRLVQPDFTGGGFVGYEMTTGGFADPVIKLHQPTLEITNGNKATVAEFRNTPPSERNSVSLKRPFPMMGLLTDGFVWLIVFIEAWICFWMWRFPRHPVTHLSILGFAVTLCVLRQELTFISVLCLLALLSCPPRMRNFRLAYGVSAIMFAALVLKASPS